MAAWRPNRRVIEGALDNTTPGRVTILRLPLRTSASISTCECGTVVRVRSSTTVPLPMRTSRCCGTSH